MKVIKHLPPQYALAEEGPSEIFKRSLLNVLLVAKCCYCNRKFIVAREDTRKWSHAWRLEMLLCDRCQGYGVSRLPLRP